MKRSVIGLLLVALLCVAGCKHDKNSNSSSQPAQPHPTCPAEVPMCSETPSAPPVPPSLANAPVPRGVPRTPIPVADANPNMEGEQLPTGNQECVLNLVPSNHGLSMKDSFNIQSNATVICRYLPTLMWVSMRLQAKNPQGGWDDEDDVLVDAHWPEPEVINGVQYYVRNYNRWAVCFPGWWRTLVSWNGVKHITPGQSSLPETFGSDLVSAAPVNTNCQ
jgi:hypothetical protein